jgi:hypothetical protein
MSENRSLPDQSKPVGERIVDFAERSLDREQNLLAEVERLTRERDRAVEQRENANAVSVRVEVENRRLREALERIDGEVHYRTGWPWAKDIHAIVRGALDEEQAP